MKAFVVLGLVLLAGWGGNEAFAGNSAAGEPSPLLLLANQPATEMQRRGFARGAIVRGPRGGIAVGPRRAIAVGPRGAVAVGPRGAVAVRRGAWVRPPNYWRRPGGAIAAGAAIGVIGAAAATAYVATRPPAPNYCWYYTNSARTQGFWDVCQ
jgi:hypothetical protein